MRLGFGKGKLKLLGGIELPCKFFNIYAARGDLVGDRSEIRRTSEWGGHKRVIFSLYPGLKKACLHRVFRSETKRTESMISSNLFTCWLLEVLSKSVDLCPGSGQRSTILSGFGTSRSQHEVRADVFADDRVVTEYEQSS